MHPASFAKRSPSASITFAPWGSGVFLPDDLINQTLSKRPLPARKWVFCFSAFRPLPEAGFPLPDFSFHSARNEQNPSGFTAEPRSISQRPHRIPRPSKPLRHHAPGERDAGVCVAAKLSFVSCSNERRLSFRDRMAQRPIGSHCSQPGADARQGPVFFGLAHQPCGH